MFEPYLIKEVCGIKIAFVGVTTPKTLSESTPKYFQDEDGNFIDVVETRDCTPEQLEIKELNIGVYVFKSKLLFENLAELKNNNAQGEYYLTDVPKILIKKGCKVTICSVDDNTEIFGVNTEEDLEFCEKELSKRQK